MNLISENNPWFVTTLDEFLYYCCPECDEKNKSKELFLEHAINNHPKAKGHFFISLTSNLGNILK